MIALILLTVSEIFDSYDPNQVRCYDMGMYERFCPRNEYPYSNYKYFPNLFKLENNEITPTIYYNKNNITEIKFKSRIICGGPECNSKYLEVYVYPEKHRDLNISSIILSTIILLFLFPFLIPIVIFISLFCPDDDDNFGGFR